MLTLKKNYAEQCSWALELQLSKFASINQVCKFLVDLDPHWYFGKVVSPNNETTPIGVNGTPKGDLGGNHILTPLDHWKKLILYIFLSKVGD